MQLCSASPARLENEAGVFVASSDDSLPASPTLTVVEPGKSVFRRNKARSGTQGPHGPGTFAFDFESKNLFVSADFCRIFGLAECNFFPVERIRALIPFDGMRAFPDSRDGCDGGPTQEIAYRIRRADTGALRWIRHRAWVESDDLLVLMSGVVEDVSDAYMTGRTEALLALSDRLAVATTVESASSIAGEVLGHTLGVKRAAYAAIELATGTYRIERDWTAKGFATLVGRHGLLAFTASIDHLRKRRPLVVADVAREAWLAPDLPSYAKLGTASVLAIPLIDDDRLSGVIFVHDSAPRQWDLDDLEFMRSVAGRTHAVIVKLKAQEEQHVINQELVHRMKNVLTIVQSIATQTLRGLPQRDVVATLQRRLRALAGSHDILVGQQTVSSSIRSIVSNVLGQLGEPAARFDLTGTDLLLNRRAALSLTMLLHELATNAIKYGALSNAAGRVTIAWYVRPEQGEPYFVFEWRERNGPPVTAPTSEGFGTRLISGGLTGSGGVEKHFLPAGLEAAFRAPLARIQRH